MQRSVYRINSSIRGFSLLEIIIGIAILGSVVAFALRLTLQSDNKLDGIKDAERLATFQQTAAQYFISNRTAIMAAMIAPAASDANVQAHCVVVIPVSDGAIDGGLTPGTAGTNGTLSWSGTKKTCSFDATLLQAKNQWPDLTINFQDPDTGGQWRYVAIFRRIMTAGPDTLMGTADDVPTNAADMLTMRMDIDGDLGEVLTTRAWSDDKTRQERSQAGRDALGSVGGVMPVGNVGWCTTNRTTTQICGNGWTVDLADFLDTAQLTTVRNKLPL